MSFPQSSHRAKADSTRGRTTPGRRLGVVLVDEPSVVRKGMALIIAREKDMEVLVEADDADEGLVALSRLHRSSGVVALVGLGLPGEHDGLWLIRMLRESFPSLRILGCGTNSEAGSVSRALLVGADGYVDKSTDPDRFLDALRRAIKAETVLEGLPANALGAIAAAIDRQVDAGPIVTERERSVLRFAAVGLTARQIGTRLGVRERTVTTHLDHIYRKLGVSGRMAAIAEANKLGLVAMSSAS